jgi:hypothetical protein
MSRPPGTKNILPSRQERAELISQLRKRAATGDSVAIAALLNLSYPRVTKDERTTKTGPIKHRG